MMGLFVSRMYNIDSSTYRIVMEGKKMLHYMSKTKIGTVCRLSLTAAICCILLGLIIPLPAYSQDGDQKSFATPEDALKDLVQAAAAEDTKELLAIFGPEGKDLVLSCNKGEEKEHRGRFVKACKELKRVTFEGESKAILHFGREDWPFPIPLVKKGDLWVFDTKTGKEEIINRRIGRNELRAIRVCGEYVQAQREYAEKDRDGSGMLKFAQRIVSSEGKHDGLYWTSKEGEGSSPFGPRIGEAADEKGAGKTSSGKPIPYHGYYYKILKRQGKDAPGGAYHYVINKNMVAGFALVAYPADYGTTGIMAFIVNQNGVVYQRDMGKETERLAKAMTTFNPDKNWKKVE